MITLEHRLRMLKIPVLEDGIINLGETSLILRTVRPYVGKGDAEADELMALLLQVRADGVITPDESNVVAGLLELLSARFDDLCGALPASNS